MTGPWFDLPSALDDDTLRLFERERELLLLTSRDAGQDSELAELRREIRARVGRYAETALERLAGAAAAEVLAEQARPATELSADERAAERFGLAAASRKAI